MEKKSLHTSGVLLLVVHNVHVVQLAAVATEE
jgi:hypothetical protein